MAGPGAELEAAPVARSASSRLLQAPTPTTSATDTASVANVIRAPVVRFEVARLRPMSSYQRRVASHKISDTEAPP